MEDLVVLDSDSDDDRSGARFRVSAAGPLPSEHHANHADSQECLPPVEGLIMMPANGITHQRPWRLPITPRDNHQADLPVTPSSSPKPRAQLEDENEV